MQSASAAELYANDLNGTMAFSRSEDFNLVGYNLAVDGNSSDGNVFVLVVTSEFGQTVRDINVTDVDFNEEGNDAALDINISGACVYTTRNDGFKIVKAFDINSDGNWFDINSMMPEDMNRGQVATLQIWKTTVVNASTADTLPVYACGSAVAQLDVIAAPHIAVNRIPSRIDQNVTVMGYGFTYGFDLNVFMHSVDDENIWLADADFNILDVNYIDNNYYLKGSNGDVNIFDEYRDNNNTGADVDSNVGLHRTINNGNADITAPDMNAILFRADENGSFDFNLTVPYIAPSHLARYGDVNIRVYDSIEDFNAYVKIAIVPDFTIGNDENVTILICDSNFPCYPGTDVANKVYVPIEQAMALNYISDTNMQATKGLRVELGPNVGVDQQPVVRISFNTDMNLTHGPPRKDITSNTEVSNAVRMVLNTTNMPEFAIDANVTMVNVPCIDVACASMPILARNGVKCPDGVCSEVTWSANATAGDGNLSFRVNTFSEYGSGTIDVNVVSPNGGQSLRKADGNVQIHFTLTDTNADNNALMAYIYLCDSNDAADTNCWLIGNDTNIMNREPDYNQLLEGGCVSKSCHDGGADMNYIYCSGQDGNVYTTTSTRDCYYDFNLSNITRDMVNGLTVLGVYGGTFWLDVNIVAPDMNYVGDFSDANFQINAPDINVTDLNWNAPHYTYSYSEYAANPSDNNMVIDFNVRVPDGNSWMDYNFSFWLSTTAGGKHIPIAFDSPISNYDGQLSIKSDANALDMNVNGMDWPVGMFWCENQIEEAGDFNAGDFDLNCHLDVNMTYEWYFEGLFYLDIEMKYDLNIGGGLERGFEYRSDIASSPIALSINDTNNPSGPTITVPSEGDTITTTYITTSYITDDNTSGVERYWIRIDSGDWIDTNTETSYTFSDLGEIEHTIDVMGMDYEDNNSGLTSRKFKVTLSGGTSGGMTGGGAGAGGGGTAEPGRTTLINRTFATPASEEIVNAIMEAAGATEEEIAAALEANAKAGFERVIKVEKVRDSSNKVTYETTITIRVENTGETVLKNVRVVEEIPKDVISHLAGGQIVSDLPYVILEADPIIEFTVETVKPGETAEVVYTIAENVSNAAATVWRPAVIAGLQEEEYDACMDMDCDDSNPCTADSCADEECQHANAAEGTSCGTDAVCKAGKCIAEEPVQPTTPTTPGTAEGAPDYTTTTIVVVIIIIVVAAYIVLKRPKASAKLKAK